MVFLLPQPAAQKGAAIREKYSKSRSRSSEKRERRIRRKEKREAERVIRLSFPLLDVVASVRESVDRMVVDVRLEVMRCILEEEVAQRVGCECQSKRKPSVRQKGKRSGHSFCLDLWNQSGGPLSIGLVGPERRPARESAASERLELPAGTLPPHRKDAIITGPTGVGKTYLFCALGNTACRAGYRFVYARAPRLFGELYKARVDGTLPRPLQRPAKANVLIIDDLGTSPLEAEHWRDLREVLEHRYSSSSTIITSQLAPKHWHSFKATQEELRAHPTPDPPCPRSLGAPSRASRPQAMLPLTHRGFPVAGLCGPSARLIVVFYGVRNPPESVFGLDRTGRSA